MARRCNRSEIENNGSPNSGPVTLPGYITLQSNRNRKGNKTWRPLQPSDLGTGEGTGDFYTDSSSSPVDSPGASSLEKSNSRPSKPISQRSPVIDKPMDNRTIISRAQTSSAPCEEALPVGLLREQQPTPLNQDSDGISPTNTRPRVVENNLRLFGPLPDIIRLHEQTGDLDGQVVFIGHPNRDVSAHQWLSASFQWVNIGLWSETRRRIEGSLASDQLLMPGSSCNTIEYFKFIAEHRETTNRHNSGPQTSQKTTEAAPSATAMIVDKKSKEPVLNLAATAGAGTVSGKKLEDPFVIAAKTVQPTSTTAFNSGRGGHMGSMDFDYEFPNKSNVTNKGHQQIYIQRERERLETLRRQSNPSFLRDSQSLLRDVEFGEEAATGFTPKNRPSTGRQEPQLSAEDLHDHLQARSKLAKFSQSASRHSLPTEHLVAVPDFQMSNFYVRNSVPTGPTVANPYRGVSTLNAAAVPYRMPMRELPAEGPDSSVTALNAHTSTSDPALRFSDPDSIQQYQAHPIANGFNKQAPTKQSWSGPFFAESIPIAHDPAASLSVQTTNQQKLVNWYRDGQNVSRQQDYTKILMAGAFVNNKARSFGVIGEGSTIEQDATQYENTHLFARIYENLFEYSDESRAGGGTSFFTRTWKLAPPHFRDLGPNGNNSFYGSRDGRLGISPPLSRVPNRPYQPYRGDNTPWGFRVLGSSSFSTHDGSNAAGSAVNDGLIYRGVFQ